MFDKYDINHTYIAFTWLFDVVLSGKQIAAGGKLMVADRQGTNARQLISPDRPERDKAAKAMLQDKQIFSLVL